VRVSWLEGIAPRTLSDHERDWLAAAEAHYHAAAEADPAAAIARANLGWARELRGDGAAAVADYEHALEIEPTLFAARRNLATLLVRLGRDDDALRPFYDDMRSGRDGAGWLQELVSAAMRGGALDLAGRYARLLAQLRRGTPWYPATAQAEGLALPVEPQDSELTLPKLRHDVEQFEYLMRRGVLGVDFEAIVARYRAVIERLAIEGEDVRVPLDRDRHPEIADVFNRIVHVRDTPRAERALSDAWDPRDVEEQYLDQPLGLVVVDDFLRPEALDEVRAFCLESTLWMANRYAHGRLGAFFHEGFSCPLLTQIAEELRAAMPRVIVDRYPLRQIWGFKNDAFLPDGATTHADFAAVNVNFWITPDDANLDPESGGLVVYDVDAPLTWDFATYNGRSDIIKPFLRRHDAKAVTIPYHQNRAIIFNSDLFHASAGLRFKPGYENRRINVTMLYGDRQSDEHHANVSGPDLDGGVSGGPPAWRSAAFSRVRRSS
jgi:hypothetical protein